MRASALRTVLLVKAIEEADPDGILLPFSERAAATREGKVPGVVRGPSKEREAGASGPLAGRAQRFLARRSRLLLERLALRYPAVGVADSIASRGSWLPAIAVIVSIASGIALSQIDGSRRINLLGYPVVGLVAWNMAIYVVLALAWIRRVGLRRTGSDEGPARGFARLAFGLSHRVHVPAGVTLPPALARALQQFAEEWWRAAGSLLTVRAKRLLHLCAAALACGVIAGLYARGIGMQYLAGWESTFLNEHGLHRLLTILLHPASLATGIELPTAEKLASIRWVDGRGGESAAPWLHLYGATAALYIVIPRLVLAGVVTLTLWRQSLRTALPPTLLAYYRQLVGGEGEGARLNAAEILPYGFEASADVRQGLERLLGAAFGTGITVHFRQAVAYGKEDKFSSHAMSHARGSVLVILFNLASTPEDENHGALIDSAHVAVARGRTADHLLIVVEESAFRARFAADPGFAGRMEERRAAWRMLGDTRGIQLACIDALTDSDGAHRDIAARSLAGALAGREQ